MTCKKGEDCARDLTVPGAITFFSEFKGLLQVYKYNLRRGKTLQSKHLIYLIFCIAFTCIFFYVGDRVSSGWRLGAKGPVIVLLDRILYSYAVTL